MRFIDMFVTAVYALRVPSYYYGGWGEGENFHFNFSIADWFYVNLF